MEIQEIPDMIDLFLHGSDISDSVLTNTLEIFFQEIELALKILPNEVWGISQALNVKRYILNKYVTPMQIKQEVTNFIVNNCYHASVFPFEVIAHSLNVENKDLIYIEISIDALNSNGLSEKFKQKFLLGE